MRENDSSGTVQLADGTESMKMDEYLAGIYRELEKKGISRSDASQIMKVADFSLQKYPEIMNDTVDDKADELIVVASILLQTQKNIGLPSFEQKRLTNTLIRCIRCGNMEDRYLSAKAEVERRFRQRIAEI